MKIRIGIDPAFRKNGFGLCIIDETSDVRFLRLSSFQDFVFWLMTDAPAGGVRCVVENSNLQDVTFRRGGRITHSQSRDAGKNMAISQCVYDLCVWKWGMPCVCGLSPREKGAKWSLPFAQGVARSMGLKLPAKMRQDNIDAFQLAVRG